MGNYVGERGLCGRKGKERGMGKIALCLISPLEDMEPLLRRLESVCEGP